MIGIQVTKQSLNDVAGNISLALEQTFRRVDSLKFTFDSTADQTLIDLGFTAEEVAVFKTAFTDLAQLADVYRGEDTQATAKDYRTFARRLWGLGDV